MMKSIFLLFVCVFVVCQGVSVNKKTEVAPMTCEEIEATVTLYEGLIARTSRLRLITRYRRSLQTLEITRNEVCTESPPCNLFAFGDDTFNAFFETSFGSPSSDIEGRLAAGTSIQVVSYSFGSKIPVLFGENHDVAVAVTGGNFTLDTGFVFGGRIIYGDRATVSTPINAELVQDADYLDFSSMAGFFAWESELLMQQEGLEVLGGTLNGDLYEVFNVKCSDLEKLTNLHIINDDASRVVVVNLLGETCSLANIGITTTGGCSNIIYNFPTATAITISEVTVTGSILAPFATITGESGQINGQVAAYAWSGPTQINWCESSGCPVGFEGSFPLNNRPAEPIAPAEPAEYSRGGVVP